MTKIMLGLFFILTLAAVALAESTEWATWWSAVPRNSKVVSTISFRWRLSSPCSEAGNCSVGLQLRNDSNNTAYVDYTICVEKSDGYMDSERDHRNFGPNEVLEVPVHLDGAKAVVYVDKEQ